MNVKCVVTGYLDENCYILIKNGTCLVVDPGSDIGKINEYLNSKNLKTNFTCFTTFFIIKTSVLKPPSGSINFSYFSQNNTKNAFLSIE